MINGLAAPVTGDHFLVKYLRNAGYEVEVIEPALGETIEKVKYEPQVIIAWSLGGLLAPKLAEKYPRSKLILIATGASVEPADPTAKKLFEVVQKDWGVRL